MANAAHYRKKKLLVQCFTQWLKQLSSRNVKEEIIDEGERRSRMYSVFAAWKFYTKERSLLKKYLFECGETINDVTQMSTVELREVVDKHKSEQSNMSLLRKSMPIRSMKANNQRHVSPDVLALSSSQTNQRERQEMKSAEFGHSRKKSNSVLSLLQKQFGPKYAPQK